MSVRPTFLAMIAVVVGCGGNGGETVPVSTAPPVRSIATVTVVLSASSIQVGESAIATASALDQFGASIATGPVSWSSTSASVASISASGAISGLAPGKVGVVATAGGRSGQQELTVVPAAVATIGIAPAAVSMNLGSTQQLVATLRDVSGALLTDRAVSWSSAAPTVASVTSSGSVTAVAAGTTTITASAEGKSGVAQVTVLPPRIAQVVVTPTSATVPVNGGVQLTATLYDDQRRVLTGRTVTWSTSVGSSGTPKVIVSPTGLVTGSAVGWEMVTAASEGVFSNSVRVDVLPEISSIEIFVGSSSIASDEIRELTAFLKDANGNTLGGRTVAWSSSAPSIASIDAVAGIVTAWAPGTTTITAKSEGKEKSIALIVDAREVYDCVDTPALGCGLGMDQFVLVPAGSFEMGSLTGEADERPVHHVTITRPFFLQKTEMTQRQYPGHSSWRAACGDLCPVLAFRYEVLAKIEQLNAHTRYKFRLPTEAEWEYAARAGSIGDTYGPLDAVSWYRGNSGASPTHPVAGKLANAWGLYDTIGNAWEWVADWYGPYSADSVQDPSGPLQPTVPGFARVTRGGWSYNKDPSAAVRRATPTGEGDTQQGFRLVRIR